TSAISEFSVMKTYWGKPTGRRAARAISSGWLLKKNAARRLQRVYSSRRSRGSVKRIQQFRNLLFLSLATDFQHAAIRFGLLDQVFIAGLNDVDKAQFLCVHGEPVISVGHFVNVEIRTTLFDQVLESVVNRFQALQFDRFLLWCGFREWGEGALIFTGRELHIPYAVFFFEPDEIWHSRHHPNRSDISEWRCDNLVRHCRAHIAARRGHLIHANGERNAGAVYSQQLRSGMAISVNRASGRVDAHDHFVFGCSDLNDNVDLLAERIDLVSS